MRIAPLASYFCSNHAMTGILFLVNSFFLQGLGKAGPATAGIIFIPGAKQWFTGYDIHIKARLVIIPVLIAKGWLGCIVLSNLVLQRG